MVSFRRSHYRMSLRRFFTRGAYWQEGPTGQRGLLASGGDFGPGGLPYDYAPAHSDPTSRSDAIREMPKIKFVPIRMCQVSLIDSQHTVRRKVMKCSKETTNTIR